MIAVDMIYKTVVCPITGMRCCIVHDQMMYVAEDVGGLLGLDGTCLFVAGYKRNICALIRVETMNGLVGFVGMFTAKQIIDMLSIANNALPENIRSYLETQKYIYDPDRVDFINNVCKVLCEIKSMKHYPVAFYRIDLYFPDQNIAVQYGEYLNGAADAKRQNAIIAATGCRFLRVLHTDNIFEALGRLRLMIAAQ